MASVVWPGELHAQFGRDSGVGQCAGEAVAQLMKGAPGGRPHADAALDRLRVHARLAHDGLNTVVAGQVHRLGRIRGNQPLPARPVQGRADHLGVKRHRAGREARLAADSDKALVLMWAACREAQSALLTKSDRSFNAGPVVHPPAARGPEDWRP